jgi:hypothetical protein
LVCAEQAEGLFAADIDLRRASDKHILTAEYDLSLFGDRRPELYGALIIDRIRSPLDDESTRFPA